MNWQLLLPEIYKDDSNVHIYPSTLALFKTGEHIGSVFSIRVGNPEELTVPLFTEEQMQEYARQAIIKIGLDRLEWSIDNINQTLISNKNGKAAS